MAKSYYRKIKGKTYDRNLLELAEKAVSGKGDGRISIQDAKRILAGVKDGASYTDIEKRTIKYIRDKFKFTKESNKWFRTEIRKWAASKTTAKAKSKAKQKKQPKKTAKLPAYDGTKIMEQLIEPVTVEDEKRTINWKFLALILVLLAVVFGIFYFSFYSKQTKETGKIAKKDSTPVKVENKADLKKDTNEKPVKSTVSEDDIENAVIPFKKGGLNFSSKEKKFLKEVVLYLKENPDHKLRITGHTCNLGDPKKNLTLSNKRAQSVKNFIKSQGIDDAQFEIFGKGQEEPIADNATDEGKIKNRRVQFEIID